MNSPNRGEVWLVDLGFAAKIRPCLVLSIPALDEDRAHVTIPHAKLARKLGTLTDDQMLDIEDTVCDWLGF